VKVAGDGLTFLYGTIIFLVMSWVVIIMRVGVRLWRKALWMDDYIMCIGLVSATISHSTNNSVNTCILGLLFRHSISWRCLLLFGLRATLSSSAPRSDSTWYKSRLSDECLLAQILTDLSYFILRNTFMLLVLCSSRRALQYVYCASLQVISQSLGCFTASLGFHGLLSLYSS